MRITSDSRYIISASEDGTIKIFSLLEGLLHCSFAVHTRKVFA
mgnify:FL=1